MVIITMRLMTVLSWLPCDPRSPGPQVGASPVPISSNVPQTTASDPESQGHISLSFCGKTSASRGPSLQGWWEWRKDDLANLGCWCREGASEGEQGFLTLQARAGKTQDMHSFQRFARLSSEKQSALLPVKPPSEARTQISRLP